MAASWRQQAAAARHPGQQVQRQAHDLQGDEDHQQVVRRRRTASCRRRRTGTAARSRSGTSRGGELLLLLGAHQRGGPRGEGVAAGVDAASRRRRAARAWRPRGSPLQEQRRAVDHQRSGGDPALGGGRGGHHEHQRGHQRGERQGHLDGAPAARGARASTRTLRMAAVPARSAPGAMLPGYSKDGHRQRVGDVDHGSDSLPGSRARSGTGSVATDHRHGRSTDGLITSRADLREEARGPR